MSGWRVIIDGEHSPVIVSDSPWRSNDDPRILMKLWNLVKEHKDGRIYWDESNSHNTEGS